MKDRTEITRKDGSQWDTVKHTCPECGSDTFRLYMIDDEAHYVMQCANCDDYVPQRYFHLPSDAKQDKWPFGPVSDVKQTVEIMIPADEEGDVILEVADFRGKDCDVVLPTFASEIGEVQEDR